MTTSERIALVIKNKVEAELAYEANPTPETRKVLDKALDVYVLFYTDNSHLLPKAE